MYTKLSDAAKTMNFLNYCHYQGYIYVISGCEHEKYVHGHDGETYYSFGQGVLKYDVDKDAGFVLYPLLRKWGGDRRDTLRNGRFFRPARIFVPGDTRNTGYQCCRLIR